MTRQQTVGVAAGVLALLLGLAGAAQGATTPVTVAVDALRPTGATVNRDVAGVAFRPGSGSYLRELETTTSRYGAGVNDDNGLVHVLFPRAPAPGQSAEELPMDPTAVARYDRDVDEMDRAGVQPIITLDSPVWLSHFPYFDGDGKAFGSMMPPSDTGVFRTLIRRTMEHFTVDRVRAGKAPVLFWEAWNEPDNPTY